MDSKENIDKQTLLTKMLVKTAMGVDKADLVIKNTSLINTNTCEIVKNVDIAIKGERICLVGDATKLIDDSTKIIDGTNMYASPGFMDGHIHVESSMMNLVEYAKAVIPLGTTAIMHDPHEIANVLGLNGIDIMVKDGKSVPLKTFTTMPSCVPAVCEFEEYGASISADDTVAYLKNKDIIGLGEMMDIFGVVNGDDDIHKKLNGTYDRNKVVTGHFTLPDTNNLLNAYVSTGINCCHESVFKEDALAKMRLGMYVQMREGSAWRDLDELVPLLVETDIDSRFACLVSDDTHPNTLLKHGHMDYIIRKAIRLGLNPVKAIQMATINTANCFKISDDYGAIAPKKYADIVLFENLEDIRPKIVIINGEVVAKDGKLLVDIAPLDYPDFALNTMNIKKVFAPIDFVIKSDIENGDVTTNVIEIIEEKAPNKHIKVSMKSENFLVSSSVKDDIVKVFSIDRHNKNNTDNIAIGRGFVKGFSIKHGAIASTVAHDCHNITVIGANDEDMAIAVNHLVKVGGGIVVVLDGIILSTVNLPLAGLMSLKPVDEIAIEIEELEKSFISLGCNVKSPFMTMALLSLAVIPELRVTNKGLVDTLKYEFINLFE